ncbi:hypothetical protein H4R33_005998, partial [Dimargaris cristalligena]
MDIDIANLTMEQQIADVRQQLQNLISLQQQDRSSLKEAVHAAATAATAASKL